MAHTRGPINDLLPCPFCGSTDVGGASGIVSCYRCGAETAEHLTTERALLAWNTRAATRAEQKDLSALHQFAKPTRAEEKGGELAAELQNLNEPKNERGDPHTYQELGEWLEENMDAVLTALRGTKERV